MCDSPDIEARGLQPLQAMPVVANAREGYGPASDFPVQLIDSHSQSETQAREKCAVTDERIGRQEYKSAERRRKN